MIVWWHVGNVAIKVDTISINRFLIAKLFFSNILAHFSCLNGDDMMLRMYPDNTWQCPHCKTCVHCYETSDAVSECKMSIYLFFTRKVKKEN